jgi:hypothetical protein
MHKSTVLRTYEYLTTHSNNNTRSPDQDGLKTTIYSHRLRRREALFFEFKNNLLVVVVVVAKNAVEGKKRKGIRVYAQKSAVET